jgi:hypothetical protein
MSVDWKNEPFLNDIMRKIARKAIVLVGSRSVDVWTMMTMIWLMIWLMIWRGVEVGGRVTSILQRVDHFHSVNKQTRSTPCPHHRHHHHPHNEHHPPSSTRSHG